MTTTDITWKREMDKINARCINAPKIPDGANKKSRNFAMYYALPHKELTHEEKHELYSMMLNIIDGTITEKQQTLLETLYLKYVL